MFKPSLFRNIDMLIGEARRNPDLNPKDEVFRHLLRYKNDDIIHVSFQNIEKVGINPNSRYGFIFDNPIGIFAYPLKAAWNQLFSNEFENEGELNKYELFALNRKYLYVLKEAPGANIKDVSFDNYAKKDYLRDTNTILEKYFAGNADENIIIDLKSIIMSPLFYKTMQYFRYLRRLLFYDICSRVKFRQYLPYKSDNPTVLMNKIFRDLGYDGFTEKVPQAIRGNITPDIKNQTVFLHKGAFNVIDRITLHHQDVLPD